MRVLACLVCSFALTACDGDDTIPDSVPVGSEAVVVAEVFQQHDVVMHVEDLGDDRLGVITAVPAYTTTICPDCEAMNIPDAECPAACSRERLEWSVIDATGTTVVGPKVLRTFVSPWSATYLGYVQTARLSSGNIAAVWSLCQGPPARSCQAELAVFTENGEPVGARVSLYQGLYGELTMTANPDTDTLLIARSSDLHTRAGVWAAIVGNDGTVLRDFTRIGSSSARAAAVVADGDGFVVVAEDHEPMADDSACPPCTRLDTCLSEEPGCSWGGRISPEGGLWAFHLGVTGNVTPQQVATGWLGDGLYYPHQTYSVARTASGLAVVSWWDTPEDALLILTQNAAEWSKATAPLARFAAQPPARWFGMLRGANDELHVFGEAIAAEAQGGFPHAFFAIGQGRVGDAFHGRAFGPTGDFGDRVGLLSGGIANDAGTAYDHWSVFRFTLESAP